MSMPNTTCNDRPATTFLPMVPVDTRTADQLAEIAWMEGHTVSWIMRRALSTYAEEYFARARAEQEGYDSGPPMN